jgi:ribonuclease P protein component
VFDKYTFPKQVRLLNKSQFQTTLTTEQPLLGKYYVFYYHSNGLTYPRLGVITAKKKCPLAVLRNRIKRQVREAFRSFQGKLPSYDMDVVARQSAREASKCELRQCLDSLFLKLINDFTG